MNGSYVSSLFVNSWQISDDILRDLNLVTKGNIESCPATGLLHLFCMKLSLGSEASSAKISSAVTSTNVLVRGLPPSPALHGGTKEITKGISASFPHGPSLLNSRGRREVRTKMLGLESNATYAMRYFCSRKGLFNIVHQCYPTQVLSLDIGLNIFRQRNLIITRQGHFL